MQNRHAVSRFGFPALFRQFVSTAVLRGLFRVCGPQRRCPTRLSGPELIMGMVFHGLAGAGTLGQHVRELTGQAISDSALSQRRQALHWQIFESILEAALKPKADPAQHPQAFYQGLRLCGLDGSRFSVANTPQIKKEMDKATSRRMKAAFAKVGVAVMVELGIHNPIAAAIGAKDESERVLAERLLDQLPERSLLIADRYYGVPKMLATLREMHPRGRREFLVRVRANIRSKVIEAYADGSAWVEVQSEGTKLLVREIAGRVRRGRGVWSEVRLWTSLLDWRRHGAQEMLGLYARRWEQEGFYRELKVDMRSAELLQSHTPLTAAQEVAALILGYALLVEERIKAAGVGQTEVLRISFLKTLEVVRGLWRFLETTDGILTAQQVRTTVRRTMRKIAYMAIPKRRQRSCPRAVRQPVSSWPRLLKNTSQECAPEYQLLTVSH